MIAIAPGDCLTAMREAFEDNTFDAIVTDPPYGLVQNKKGGSGVASVNLNSPHGRSRIGTGNGPGGFMGKEWDSCVPGVPFWTEALRVAKPGAHLVAFGGTRTYHRLACAIEDAGWEVRDCLSWLYGSGFPKSHDVSKAIDKAAGAEREKVPATGGLHKNRNMNDDGWSKIGEGQPTMDSAVPATDAARQWQGWGTALKPAWEPIILARKPLIGTVAANVLAHGTGALNIDGCRIGFASDADKASAFPGGKLTSHGSGSLAGPGSAQDAERSGFDAQQNAAGRWPANLVLDEEAAAMLDKQTGERGGSGKASGPTYAGPSVRGSMSGGFGGMGNREPVFYGDSGGASRFFYTAKASRKERGEGNTHPTVKPIALMRWLVRLVTPKGGVVLDPFCGSGTTLLAAQAEGFDAVGIEREAEYVEIIKRRLGDVGVRCVEVGL